VDKIAIPAKTFRLVIAGGVNLCVLLKADVKACRIGMSKNAWQILKVNPASSTRKVSNEELKSAPRNKQIGRDRAYNFRFLDFI
jgi:hypothetical protein